MKKSLKFIPKDPINKNASFDSDNGLAQARRQAIIETNDGLCLLTYIYIYIWISIKNSH